MKITKNQLRRIIAEEKQMLQEGGMIGPIPSQDVCDHVHDEVLDMVGEFLVAYGVAHEFGNFTDNNAAGLAKVVQDAAEEAVQTALRSVGFNTRVR